RGRELPARPRRRRGLPRRPEARLPQPRPRHDGCLQRRGVRPGRSLSDTKKNRSGPARVLPSDRMRCPPIHPIAVLAAMACTSSPAAPRDAGPGIDDAAAPVADLAAPEAALTDDALDATAAPDDAGRDLPGWTLVWADEFDEDGPPN